MKTNATRQTVIEAIEAINNEHDYSIGLNRNDQTGKWFNFTIASPSKVPGARVSGSGRNLAKASWHAHGYLFDAIFAIEPDAIIQALGNKITKNAGNWQDVQIGSLYNPIYMSECSIH
jgi:hypothetical protein